MSKNLNISLRIPLKNRDYLDRMGEIDKRTNTAIINHMIEYFMQEGSPEIALKKLYKR